ncbi:hypothetical protein PGT21_022095 [Puccinia graminis f. sp. tritici]|uniref:Uncharacterized protein n=1 Tax=Puccinia graminis f. sp. tritici TaxID=56615 RepID=A0A5B0MAI2_PUCGR|nr:hypothetical protein PGT21_022095 [Puccinia graminis f. sp. tritici]
MSFIAERKAGAKIPLEHLHWLIRLVRISDLFNPRISMIPTHGGFKQRGCILMMDQEIAQRRCSIEIKWCGDESNRATRVFCQILDETKDHGRVNTEKISGSNQDPEADVMN